jgi:putative transcriptional regulator
MKKDLFAELVESVREMRAVRRGERKPARGTVVEPVHVQAIRRRLGMTQPEFAQLIGVSVATLRNWEQGRRQPHGPARALLKVVAKNPAAVLDAQRG